MGERCGRSVFCAVHADVAAGGRREPVAANWLTKGFARTGELANQPPAGFVFALPTKTHGVPVRAFAH